MKNAILLSGILFVSTAFCQPSRASATGEEKTYLNSCASDVHAWNITLKHDIASFMGVSLERMPALFCQRLAAGVRSGRISYSDINNLQLDQPTEIWMVIKGKPKASKATQVPAPWTREFRTCNGLNGTFQVLASQKCPVSSYAHDQSGVVIKRKSKAGAQAQAQWMLKFRTCKGTEGAYQIPISQKCRLSGYAY